MAEVTKTCPGCGAPTEPVTVSSITDRGAQRSEETFDTWCVACLKAKIVAAVLEPATPVELVVLGEPRSNLLDDRGPCSKCEEPTARRSRGRWLHGWCEKGLPPGRYIDGIVGTSHRRATGVS